MGTGVGVGVGIAVAASTGVGVAIAMGVAVGTGVRVGVGSGDGGEMSTTTNLLPFIATLASEPLWLSTPPKVIPESAAMGRACMVTEVKGGYVPLDWTGTGEPPRMARVPSLARQGRQTH